MNKEDRYASIDIRPYCTFEKTGLIRTGFFAYRGGQVHKVL